MLHNVYYSGEGAVKMGPTLLLGHAKGQSEKSGLASKLITLGLRPVSKDGMFCRILTFHLFGRSKERIEIGI